MSKYDLNLVNRYGIHADGAKGLMAYDSKNGSIVTDYEKTARMLAQDAVLSANNAFPAAFYQYIDPRVVEILFAKKASTALAPEIKQGSWTDEYANFPVEEISGGVTGYSDYQNGKTSDVNYNYPVRAQYRFQTAIKYGDLETDKAAAAKIAIASRKQTAAADIIARFANKSYLFGVAGKQIYGLLNDPNLNASISPVSVSGHSTWSDKQADSPSTFANVVYNDIAKLIGELFTNNGGNVDANSEMVLGISNVKAASLVVPNSFGLTAQAMLQQNYPNLRIEQIPELHSNAGDTLYLIVPSLIGTDTANCAYSEKYRLSRLVASETAFTQKAIGTTWGAIIRRPSLIARMTGI